MKVINGKLYEVCASCAKIVCVNKTFFGSMHVCTTPEEQKKFKAEIASEVKVMREMLEQSK